MKKATNKILSLALVVMMLINTFAMIFAYAETETGAPSGDNGNEPCTSGIGAMVIDFTKFKNDPENGITYKNGGVRFDGMDKGNVSAKVFELDRTSYPLAGNKYEVSYWIEAADDSSDRATFSTINGSDSSGNKGRFSWTIYGNNAQLTHARYYQNGTNKGSLSGKPERDVVDGKQFFKVVIDGTNMTTKVANSDVLYGEVSMYALSGGEYKLYDTRWHALETSRFYFMFWAFDTINSGDYMEVGGVTITQLCADNDNDHKCDTCKKVMSECSDVKVIDHKCDVCGEVISECAFDKKVIANEYHASIATCTEKATYYYSCVCGAKGTETFEYGSALGHIDGDDEGRICDREGCNEDNAPSLGGEGTTVSVPKDYAGALDKEKLWDVDFSSEYFTHNNDDTSWKSNLANTAVIFEEEGSALKIDGPKYAVDAEGNPTEEIEVPSDLIDSDSRFIGQLEAFDLDNKTYTYEFEYFRKGVVRSKFYYANGTFMNFGGCVTSMPNLGLEISNNGYRHMRQSSYYTDGLVGKPDLFENAETGEKTTRMKVVLEGGVKLKNVTLYEGNWTTPTSGVKTWTGDIIPITFTIYNTIVKEDGTYQDIRVATNLIYQPADVKLVFGIGEFNPLENGQYYGVRDLAVYKGDTSIPYDFNFENVYDYTEWGEQLAAFDPRGISNDAYNFANGYNWSTLSNGEGISVDAEGVVTINSDTDKSQGAYTPHPFGNQWNLGYYELEMTVNNAHRLKLDIIKSGDQDRVGFDILPNGSASSFAGSMGDEKAYLTAGNAASLYVSAGNSFGDGVINAGGLKTIIYDKYVADANGDGIPEDPRNVRDYGANRANIKITFDCVNYIITLYEKCSSTWVATAAIDYSESVAQGLDSSLYLGFMAWDKGANVTAKNIKLLKGMSAAHLHTWSISDYTSDLYAYYDSTVPAKLATEFVTKYGLDSAKFGWTVDGKTLCKDMKAAYDKLKTTMYGPQTINLVPILVYEKIATAPVVRGIQLAHNEDNTAYSIRFISAIGDRDDFHKVGYEIKKTIKVGDQITTVTDTLETDTVYSYINVNGTKYYAEAIGGEYIVSLGYADEAVVENSEVTYEITTYYVSRDGNKVTDKNAVSITLVDGQY